MRPFAALLPAVALGCLVDLSPQRDCGDGYIDELAGEECEPSRADSLAGRCPVGEVPGPDACDPNTCTFDLAACTRCGNGVLDPGEACDPEAMNQLTCPLGGVAYCRSDCTIDRSGCAHGCGDGVVDPDEECEPPLDESPDDLAAPILCIDLPAPIESGYGKKEYAGPCDRETCQWGRSSCSYCDNLALEDRKFLGDKDLYLDFEGMTLTTPEVCDRHSDGTLMVDEAALVDYCRGVCETNSVVHCAITCADSCKAFVPATDEPPDHGCCTPRGQPCPYQPGSDDLEPGRKPCCHVLESPEDAGSASCETNGLFVYTCR
ncbi:hypothetical protein [Nannocystis sp. SCPEA4]|uniref:hypothetical protein n=1 Tax=Nannocystis sp. SCPEA4 TaxID=2996787 RepID=UPI00226F0CD1|nr:hypothetical protein [Nannocystis sp. SCPEA4]MCY1060755.1 hypothetical protein [Nannocystis sp. SCPEA4]